MKKNDKKAYSIIVIIIIIGFLIVLSGGVFRLVFNDFKDNQVIGNYIKTYAGAESGQEIALFTKKELGENYLDGLENSNILLKENEEHGVKVSYKNNSKIKEFSGELNSGETAEVYLYWFENGNYVYTRDLEFIGGEDFYLTIDEITNTGEIISYKKIGDLKGSYELIRSSIDSSGNFSTTEKKLDVLLVSDTKKILKITNGSGKLKKYTVKSSDWFISPKIDIKSSGEYREFRTNLKTEINNIENGGAVFSVGEDSNSSTN